MSTVSPQTEQALAERLNAVGMHLLDAPVSGGPGGAKAGTLTIMIGGDAEDVARARPILEVLGGKLFHTGPLGAGQSVKLINNMVGGGILALVSEGLTMAARAGLDLNQTIDVMSVSSAASALLEARGKAFIVADQFAPGFKAHLMRKDLKLALELAQRLGVTTPVASAALPQYDEALNAGLADEDFAAVAKVYQRAAGLR